MVGSGHLTTPSIVIYDDAMSEYQGHVLLTTGSREFTNMGLVKQELARLPRPTFVIHGGAKGADRLVSEAIQGPWQEDHRSKPDGLSGLIEVRVPYLRMEEKRGGHARNEAMLQMLVAFREAGYDCWAIAFHADIQNPSPGTNGMIKLLNGENFSIIHVDGASQMVM